MRIIARVKEPEKILIDTPYIRLDSLLKLADLVDSGGHAKMVILNGEVRVNGEVCVMRGKKLRDGDVAEFDHVKIKVAQRKSEEKAES